MDHTFLTIKYATHTDDRPSHFHDCHQLLYVTAGRARIRIGTERFEVGAGQLVIFSRFEQHSVERVGSTYERYILRVSVCADPGAEPEAQDLLSLLVDRPPWFARVIDLSDDRAGADRLFSSLYRECESGQPFGSYMKKLLFYELLVYLRRRLPMPDQSRAVTQNTTVQSIKAELEQTYSLPHTLPALARKYGFSPSYLSHLFKKITGTSVMGYLLACRLAAAKRLLAQSDRSVSEIADDCGFSDHSDFSRCFKQSVGITPSEFRKTYRR